MQTVVEDSGKPVQSSLHSLVQYTSIALLVIVLSEGCVLLWELGLLLFPSVAIINGKNYPLRAWVENSGDTDKPVNLLNLQCTTEIKS